MAKSAKQPKRDAGERSILINFVLDASGSMEAIRQATISGFNEFKNDQAREDGNAFFTLTLFDTEFVTVCSAVPVREVPDLEIATYAPGGMTALYDAIGHTMRITDDFVAANKPDQVLFVIMTDGEENSSREFSRDAIFSLIRDRQKLNDYEFIYLGANQDSFGAGRDIGVRDGRMMDWAASPEETRSTMQRASRNVSAFRRRGEAQSEVFFDAATESLGAIDPAAWSKMSAAEKREHLEDGATPGSDA